MGAGANRMNKYTVGKATKGLCEYLKNEFAGEKALLLLMIHAIIRRLLRNAPQRFCAITGLRPFFLRRLCPLPYFLFSKILKL